MWDADPTDTTGVALGSTIGVGGRYSVTYGGAVDSLLLNGSRYWTRSRTRTTAPAWSAWSETDWFETRETITVSLPSSVVAIGGGALANQQATATLRFTYQTSFAHGVTVQARGESDTWALSDGVPGGPTHQIAGWQLGAAPSVWPATTYGRAGLTVLAASAGKDTATWGTGSGATDFTNNRYAWPSASTPVTLVDQPDYQPALQTVDIGLRAAPDASTDPGAYAATLQITAIANP